MRFSYIAIAAAGLLACACAHREAEDTTRLEQASLDAWIAKYVTAQGIDVVRQSNGMWVEFFEGGDGDQTIDSGRDTTVWFSLAYTSTDVAGNVFATRDSIEAMRQHTFTPHTYYSPQFVPVMDYNLGMAPGQYFALKNDLVKPDGSRMKLSRGSRVKLYIPSFLAYGSNSFSDDQGYGGQYPLGSNKIVIEDITVRDVIKNPLSHEEEIVKKLAMEKWGKGETDTIAPGMWGIEFTPVSETLRNEFPNKEPLDEYKLTIDSTTTVWFVGRFLPTEEYPHGFIFDTNIESVYDEFFNRREESGYTAQEKTFSALTYKPSQDKDSYISAFYRAIPELRRGQWFRIVFPSSYGYGYAGLSRALQQQQEYYNAQMAQYYAYSSMYSGYGSYGGYGYGSGYGGYGYDYYDYLNYSTSGYSTESSKQSIVTEIQSYTPLMFDLYIEVEDDDDDE
jgi:hypothetical protein